MTDDLAKQIAAMQQVMAAQIPPEVMGLIQDATKKLVDSGISQQAALAGRRAPDFTLPDIDGASVSLSGQLLKGPVVLSFYRGGWCPYCNLELRALQGSLSQIEATGASLLAIAPELPEKGASTRESAALSFPLLSDFGNSVAARYGLVFTLAEALRPAYAGFGFDIPAVNGDDSFTLPMPATYIINRDGLIKHAFVSADYTQRMEPAEIIDILETL